MSSEKKKNNSPLFRLLGFLSNNKKQIYLACESPPALLKYEDLCSNPNPYRVSGLGLNISISIPKARSISIFFFLLQFYILAQQYYILHQIIRIVFLFSVSIKITWSFVKYDE